MSLAKYKMALIYPFMLWFIFKVISLLFGFTTYPDLSQEMLLNDTTPFLPLMFGFWIGAASFAIEPKLSKALLNALIVSFLIGSVSLVFLLTLINNSPLFLTYASAIYASKLAIIPPIMNLGISKWFVSMFTCVAAAGAIFAIKTSKGKGKF